MSILRNEIWTQIWDEIERSPQIKVYRHVNPDPDAYGSQYAMAGIIRQKFPQKKIACIGEKVARLHHFYESFVNDVMDETQPCLHVVLDTANTGRIDGLQSIEGLTVIKIDHHPNVDAYGTIQFINDQTPATCAILLEDFLEQERLEDLHIPVRVLECLYAGIIADTGNFSYGIGLNQAFFANVGVLFERINTKQLLERFYAKTIEEVRFKGFFANNIQAYSEGFYHVTFSSADVVAHGVSVDFATSLVNVMSEVEGAKVWASFCEVPEEQIIRCSLRSRYLRISDIAAKYGGGGHPQASGVRVKTWEEVALIQEDIKELIARDDN